MGEERNPPVTQPEPASQPEEPVRNAEGVSTLWRTLEPEDATDPVPHEECLRVTGSAGWALVGASLRGKAHAHDGTYREDSFHLTSVNGWHVVAVADGLGSCARSRVGAAVATRSAVAAVAGILNAENGRAWEGEGPPEPSGGGSAGASPSPLRRANGEGEAARPSGRDAEPVARAALQAGLEQALVELTAEAERRGLAPRDLATTLLLLLHRVDRGSDLVATAQVGDGLLAAWQADGSVRTLAEAAQGEYGAQVVPLTQNGAAERAVTQAQIRRMEPPPRMLLAMTDGVADDFFPPEQNLPKLLEHLDRVALRQDADTALLDLLRYEKRGSFDDRTLVMLFPGEGEAPAEPIAAGAAQRELSPPVLASAAGEGEAPAEPIAAGAAQRELSPPVLASAAGEGEAPAEPIAAGAAQRELRPPFPASAAGEGEAPAEPIAAGAAQQELRPPEAPCVPREGEGPPEPSTVEAAQQELRPPGFHLGAQP